MPLKLLADEMGFTVEGVDLANWADRFDELFAQVVAPFFGCQEPRLRTRWYLLSGPERKNGWSLVEFARDARPKTTGAQRL